MTNQFKINARLHSIINVHRANNEIIFVSADKLTEDFRNLRSKRVMVLIAETNGHIEQVPLPLPDDAEPKPEPLLIVIPGQPIGKPRMTQADRWRKRDCVLRYFAWCDRARKAAEGKIPKEIEGVTIRAYFAMPDSWPHSKKLQMDGTKHFQKPDYDNIEKAVTDALLENDEIIADANFSKRWTLGEPRVEVIFS
jgi:Holliday junction resolvase RusA-like endonuclease